MTYTAQSAGNSPVATKIPPSTSILVVDDEALIRWSVTETLEAAGHHVFEAGSAREALDSLGSAVSRHAVVLLDLKLPDSSDLGLLRRIREAAPESRVILMTAYGTPEVLEEALRLGAFGILAKPFDLHTMLRMVNDAASPPQA